MTIKKFTYNGKEREVAIIESVANKKNKVGYIRGICLSDEKDDSYRLTLRNLAKTTPADNAIEAFKYSKVSYKTFSRDKIQ